MNTHHATTNHCPNPLSIRLPAIALDEKAAFVESICDTLIESRFGPGRACQLIIELSDRPELEPAVFYDLSDGAQIPCYAISPVGRNGYQLVESAFRKAKQMGLTGPQGHSAPAPPATLGRGSPPPMQSFGWIFENLMKSPLNPWDAKPNSSRAFIDRPQAEQ